jgi:hypothetical protein
MHETHKVVLYHWNHRGTTLFCGETV